MKRKTLLIRILFWCLASGVIFTDRLAADGLSVTPAKILLENLIPGRTYDLSELADLPLTVKNTSGRRMRFFLSVQRPDVKSVEKGFEPLPDAGWITLSPVELELENGESGKSRIVIRIPQDEKYKNQKYEAGILTAGRDPSGQRRALDFEVELLSRICFTVSPLKEGETEQDKKIDLNFNFSPQNIFLSNFTSVSSPGAKTQEKILLLENLNSTERSYFLKRIKPSDALVGLPAGYEEAPEDSSVEFSMTNVRLEALGKTGIRTKFSIPDSEAARGKRYLFVLSARAEGRETRGTKLVKVYAGPFR